MTCQHIVTKGKAGKTGSWCTNCGDKVYELETRECKDCKSYFERLGNYSGCRKHLMAVSPTMKATYEIKKGTCFSSNDIKPES